MSWTLEEVKSLKGKNIIITGGNSGLGYEAVKMLVKKDAKVIMASRSIERGEASVKKIKETYPNADIDVLQLDLASKKSIKNFVSEYQKKYQKIDVLLNNAGIMTTPYGLTADGLEQQQGVNHFGHFYLTALLFKMIKNTPNSRVVSVSSIAHRGGNLNFDNMFYSDGKKYSKVGAYSRSKLQNLLFTYELDRRVQEKNLDVKVLVAHPGVASTNLGRHIKSNKTIEKSIKRFQKIFSHTAADGALSLVRACLDENAKSGEFYGPKGFMGMRGVPHKAKSNKKSHNPKMQKQLWTFSEEVMNIDFIV